MTIVPTQECPRPQTSVNIALSNQVVTITGMAKTTAAGFVVPANVSKGKKVGLRTLCKEDVAVATPWFSDLEFVTCLTARGVPMSMANEEEWYEKHVKNTDQSVQFAICELKTAKHVGNCALFGFTQHGTARFGIGIGDRTAWGKGYGTDATRLVAEYGCFFLNLHNIRLSVYGFNKRAISAYLAAGFKEAGRIRGAICVAGQRYDEVLMDITRDDVDMSNMRKLVPFLNDQIR